jgi:succinate dehydrogenase/fumarate reductase-like Fe-S protein
MSVADELHKQAEEELAREEIEMRVAALKRQIKIIRKLKCDVTNAETELERIKELSAAECAEEQAERRRRGYE